LSHKSRQANIAGNEPDYGRAEMSGYVTGMKMRASVKNGMQRGHSRSITDRIQILPNGDTG